MDSDQTQDRATIEPTANQEANDGKKRTPWTYRDRQSTVERVMGNGLTPEERSEVSKKAAKARWSRRGK